MKSTITGQQKNELIDDFRLNDDLEQAFLLGQSMIILAPDIYAL